VRESWNDVLLDPGVVELPADPTAIFGRDAPLAVEIGFGAGRFFAQLAAHRQDWNVLGVEISPACHSRCYERVREAGLENARLFKGSGEFVVREVLPAESVREVWVNFPDPWPKDRHRDRRLLDEDFYRVLAGRLEPGGELLLTTDHDDYYDWALESVEPLEYYSIRRDPPAPSVETRYGEKWRREGREFRRAAIERTGSAPWVPRTIEVIETMHHATIEGELPSEIGPFDRGVRRLDEGVVAVQDVYERLGDGELVALVHVEESELVQKVLVEVAPGSDEGRLTVRIRRFNQPLMTEGTAAAVEHVAGWVVSLREGNEIVGRQY